MTARKINKLKINKKRDRTDWAAQMWFLPPVELLQPWQLGVPLNALTVQISRLYRYHKGKIRSS